MKQKEKEIEIKENHHNFKPTSSSAIDIKPEISGGNEPTFKSHLKNFKISSTRQMNFMQGGGAKKMLGLIAAGGKDTSRHHNVPLSFNGYTSALRKESRNAKNWFESHRISLPKLN